MSDAYMYIVYVCTIRERWWVTGASSHNTLRHTGPPSVHVTPVQSVSPLGHEL